MGSHATQCSSLLKFMDAMEEKHKKQIMQKRSNVKFVTQSIGANNTGLLAKQKSDTAKALKAAMDFDYSKLKKAPEQKYNKIILKNMRKSDKKKLVQKIIKLHEKGTRLIDIAKILNMSAPTVRDNLIRLGYDPITKKNNAKEKQKKIDSIVKLHKQGMPFADIVRETKIPRCTARTYLIEAGYTPIPYNRNKD